MLRIVLVMLGVFLFTYGDKKTRCILFAFFALPAISFGMRFCGSYSIAEKIGVRDERFLLGCCKAVAVSLYGLRLCSLCLLVWSCGVGVGGNSAVAGPGLRLLASHTVRVGLLCCGRISAV